MTKPRVALHIIMPNQISGPNVSNRRVAESAMSREYEFVFVSQSSLAGGKINLGLIWEMRRQFRELRPDLVHLSGLQSSGFHAIIAARLAGCRNILVTVHGFSGDAVVLSPLRRFMFTNVIEPLTLRLSRNFLTVCEDASSKPMIQRRAKQYLGVIHNAAPNVDFCVRAARRSVRQELGVADEDFLVVVSGRMVYDKGLSFIADAMDRVVDRSVRWVFLGDGEYRKILASRHERLVRDHRLLLLGQTNDVLRLLSGCDLFLFATLHENLSNALLEAMAVGLPVVATHVGGNVEVVEHEGNGYLIPPGDSDAIAERVLAIRADPRLQESFSERSGAIIRERFSEEVVYPALAYVYAKMLAKART